MIVVDEDVIRANVRPWCGLVRTGAWAALANVVLIATQIAIYIIWPSPQTVSAFFQLLTRITRTQLLCWGVPLFGTGSTRPRGSRPSRARMEAAADLVRFT